MRLLLKISPILLGSLFILAGINHFRNPDIYRFIIPEYIPYPLIMNYLSGVIEIVLGASLLFKKTRKIAAWGLIILLVAFVPVHIFMIQKAPFMMGKLLITPTIAWIRLPLQLVLILWAYVHTKNRN